MTVEEGGRRRDFGAGDLPLAFGAGTEADVVLDGVQGSLQVGRLDDVFFVQPGRSARNVRVGGEPLTGTRALRDGDVIAFDRARLECRVAGNALAIRIDWIVTAGDTAPPDLDELARGGRPAEIAITPIAFKPGAAAGARIGQTLEQGHDRCCDGVRSARGGRRGSPSRRNPLRSTSSRNRLPLVCRARCSS